MDVPLLVPRPRLPRLTIPQCPFCHTEFKRLCTAKQHALCLCKYRQPFIYQNGLTGHASEQIPEECNGSIAGVGNEWLQQCIQSLQHLLHDSEFIPKLASAYVKAVLRAQISNAPPIHTLQVRATCYSRTSFRACLPLLHTSAFS